MTHYNAIALAMIVKDCASALDECLESTQGFYDYLSITDTGSSDDTVEVAEKYGAQVSYYNPPDDWQYPFIDDFAKARNISFGMIPPSIRWVSWLDSDDILIGADILREKVLQTEETPIILTASYTNQEYVPIRPRVWTAGIFKWIGRVHEELQPIIYADTKYIGKDCYVRHNRKEKDVLSHQQRDIVLLRLDITDKQTIDNSFQLACHLLTLDAWKEMLEESKKLFQYVIDDGSNEFLVIKSKYKLALIYLRMGEYQECLNYCYEVIQTGKFYRDTLFYKNTLKMIDKLYKAISKSNKSEVSV